MTAVAAHARMAAAATVAAAATWAGRAVRTGPGITGAGLVCYGLGEMYRPLLWLAAGGFLLLLDRRVQ